MSPAAGRWRPQPGPQAAFVASPVFEVVYDSARRGGKTDAALGDCTFHARMYRADADAGRRRLDAGVGAGGELADARQLEDAVGAMED
jgi:hypothetical protein